MRKWNKIKKYGAPSDSLATDMMKGNSGWR